MHGAAGRVGVREELCERYERSERRTGGRCGVWRGGGGRGEKQKEVHDRSRGRTGLKLLMPAANRFSVAL